MGRAAKGAGKLPVEESRDDGTCRTNREHTTRTADLPRMPQDRGSAGGCIPAHESLSRCSTIARPDGDLRSYVRRARGAAWMCFSRTQNDPEIDRWERIEQ
jgi:hypothetical protein